MYAQYLILPALSGDRETIRYILEFYFFMKTLDLPELYVQHSFRIGQRANERWIVNRLL